MKQTRGTEENACHHSSHHSSWGILLESVEVPVIMKIKGQCGPRSIITVISAMNSAMFDPLNALALFLKLSKH